MGVVGPRCGKTDDEEKLLESDVIEGDSPVSEVI